MSSILVLVGVLSASSTTVNGVEPSLERTLYCQKLSSSDEQDDKELKQCIALAKLLGEAETQHQKAQNSMNVLANKCEDISRKIFGRAQIDSISVFDTALQQVKDGNGNLIFGEKPSQVSFDTTGAINLCEHWPSSPTDQDRPKELRPVDSLASASKQADGILTLLREEASADVSAPTSAVTAERKAIAAKLLKDIEKAQTDFAKAKLEADSAKNRFARSIRDFSDWRAGQSLQAAIAAGNAGGPRRPDRVDLASCNPLNLRSISSANGEYLADAAVLTEPERCRRLAIFEARPLVGYRGQPSPPNPTEREFDQTLTVGTSGSALELVLKGEAKKFARGFTPDVGADATEIDKYTRRPRSITYTLGVEAKADDGAARVFGRNSEDDNRGIFSLDRINSDVVFKGSIAYNFFARQTFAKFREEREKFLKEAQAACSKSLADGSTAIITSCRDSNLIVWLHEVGEKTYKRKELVDKYNTLISKSSEKYPRFGFGGNLSFGFLSVDSHQFSDLERKFDSSIVDRDFFVDDPEINSAFDSSIENKLGYSIGAFGYYHKSIKKNRFLRGVTFVGTGTYKFNLEEGLSDQNREICRADFPNLSFDGFEEDDLVDCRSTLPFRPNFQQNWVGAFETRIGLKPIWILPESGIAPKISYEIVDRNEGAFAADGSLNGKFRVDVPWFFSAKDKKLTGGVAYAYEVDYLRGDNSRESVFYIFFGRTFSLDGSK